MSFSTCRQAKIFYNAMCAGKKQSIFLLSRVELRRMVQFLSGHGGWAKHLALCKLQVDYRCQLCDGKGIKSPEHLLFECLGLLGARREIFGVNFFDSVNPFIHTWDFDKLYRYIFCTDIVLINQKPEGDQIVEDYQPYHPISARGRNLKEIPKGDQIVED